MPLGIANARATGQSQLLKSSEQARFNLFQIVGLLKLEHRHVAALHEVGRGSLWNGSFDHAQFLADKSDVPYLFSGHNAEVFFFEYGTVLF